MLHGLIYTPSLRQQVGAKTAANEGTRHVVGNGAGAVKKVRGRARPLSVAEVKRLKEEHAQTHPRRLLRRRRAYSDQFLCHLAIHLETTRCQCKNPLTLSSFLSSLEGLYGMANPEEKRAAERFPVSPNSACVFASPVLEDFGPVKLVNLSLIGVGFISTEKLHDNLMMAIKLENVAKKFAKAMLVRVVHVTLQPGGTYLVGGIFDTALTYDELCNFVM